MTSIERGNKIRNLIYNRDYSKKLLSEGLCKEAGIKYHNDIINNAEKELKVLYADMFKYSNEGINIIA